MSEPRQHEAIEEVLEADAASHAEDLRCREGSCEARPSPERNSIVVQRRPPAPAPSHPPFRMARAFALPARLVAPARDACESAVRSGTARGRVRVWVPCCKTGAATYTVAMLLMDAAALSVAPVKLAVFGTDDDEEALALARAGRYPAGATLGLDPALRTRFTRDEGEVVRVCEALRQVCIFSRHELLRDPPLTRMDLIVCGRVFDGLAPARRSELVDGFHFALRDGGLLLALDHAESFPEARFERLGDGQLRARRPRASASHPPRRSAKLAKAVALSQQALAAIDRRLAHAREALSPLSSGALGNPGDVGHFVHTLGVPLLLCAADLRVIYLSREAREAFDLSESERGAELDALCPRLPGGLDVAFSARQVAARGGARRLSVRSAQRLYLVRISAARDGRRDRSVSILFTDVTPFGVAAHAAAEEQDRQAALARLLRRAYGSEQPSAVYEEALDALNAIVRHCSSTAVLTFAAPAELEVVASRGLGPDPLRALHAMPGVEEWLEAALARAGTTPHGGEPPSTLASDDGRRVASMNAAPLQTTRSDPAGIVYPIASHGEVLGVLALLGPVGSNEAAEQDFVAAVAGVLGEAIIQRRTRRRLELERKASALFAGADTLGAVGAGLQRALSLHHVETVEIEVARGAADHWERLYPEGAAAVQAPPCAGTHGGDSPIFARTAAGGELFVAAEGRSQHRCRLRLRGAGLRAPDPALAEGLRFVARLLARFVDRVGTHAPTRNDGRQQRERRSELEALYSALPVVVSIHDAAGALRRINRRGATPAPAAPEPGSGAVTPEPSCDAALERLYAREIPAWIARVLATDESILGVELTSGDRRDRRFWLCNFAPIRDEHGRRQGVTAVVQDISPLKRLEATLREAIRSKDDFFALLGHELRNPIAAIQNATALLGRVEQPTPQLTRLQAIYDRQTTQATRLVDGLLDVARVARSKVELRRQPLGVAQLVRQAVEDRAHQFEGHRLELRWPESELWAFADRVRMLQIVDNLFSNALRFTPEQGQIEIAVQRADDRGVLRVADDGAGIEPEFLPHLFEPFRQGRSKGQTRGLGLGLALVKGLCDLHGFRITAHSEGLGRGAVFLVEFPLVHAPEAAAPESRLESRRLDLLLVEDNGDVADTLAELLRAEGHTVDVAGSGERAIEMLRERRRDVVLSDIGLPGMDGIELARRLRKDPELASSRLVALTGFGDAATEARIENAGFERSLIKPVELEALRRCLARMTLAQHAPADRR